MSETVTSKLEKLKQRKAKLEAEIAKAETANRKAARAKETRRKILVGAAILAEIEAEPSLKGVLQDILKRRLTQDRDRELLADLLNGQ
jgi:septal ring factor EnvC (AmiA/AmiB activator)